MSAFIVGTLRGHHLCGWWIAAVLGGMIISDIAAARVIEEIVVTAQKREESIQDVGLSITAMSGEQMRELGLLTSSDVAAHTPGLNMDGIASGPYTATPTIRGVAQNDFSAIQEPPNAVYVDGTYISSNAAASFGLFDINRVEVLRGPQGTLFGRNATGGVIQFVSRQPTEQFESYIDTQAYDQNGFGWRSEMAVSGPLGERTRGRVAAYYENRAGIWDNNLAGAKDTYEKDGDYAVRGILNFEVSETLDVDLTVTRGDYNRSENGTYTYKPGAVDPATGLGYNLTPENDPNAINGVCPGCDFFGQDGSESEANDSAFNDIGYLEKEYWSATVDVAWELGQLGLTSITNYQDFFSDYAEDCDGSPIDFCIFPIETDYDQISQEVRLDGETGSLTWQTGIYYLNIDATSSSGFQSTAFDFATGDLINQETESWAVFAQGEYRLSQALKATVGLRWTEDDKEIVSLPVLTDGSSADPSVINQPENVIDRFVADQPLSDWAGKLSIDYTPNESWLLFAGVTRGIKAGGFVANLNGFPLGAEDREFGPEVLTSYEAGFKADNLFDKPIRLNSSVFYYDYDDYQSFDFFGLVAFIRNRDAEVYGGEIELAASLEDGWQVLVGLAGLNTKVKGVGLPTGLVVSREAPKSPEFTANGLVLKEWSALGGTVSTQLDFSYASRSYSSVANSEAARLGSYFITNARIGYTSGNERWDVAAFARNLTDEDVPVFAYDLSGFFGVNIKSFGPPRMVGVQARFSWF